MAASGDSGDTSDETFDILCSACKEQNKNVKAKKFCMDCQDYYCTVCLKLHTTLPALRGHKLLDTEAAESGKVIMVPTERCDRHNYKTVDMYCQNHNEIGCGTCMSVDHRSCQDVFYIPEYVKENATIVPEFLQRVTDIGKKLESLLTIFKEEGIFLQANKHQEIKKVKSITKQLEKRIKEAEKDAILKVGHKYKELNENLHKDIDKIQKELENVRSSKADIEGSIKNESQSFVTMVTRDKYALAAEETSTQVEKIELGKRLMFLLDPLSESLTSRKLCLGRVINVPHNFVYKEEFNIECSSDTSTCEIYDSCILSDGSILLTDGNNKKLKLINAAAPTAIDTFTLTSAPWGVCCMEDNDAAVCLPYEKKVQICKVNCKLSSGRFLKLDFSCRGISHHDDTFYISDEFSLYTCNKEGKILKTISKDSSGKQIFSGIYNVFVNRNSKHIFVNDLNKGVICIDSHGTILHVVSNEIASARGLVAALKGKIFACGYSSKNVIVLDENGAFEDVVIKDVGLTGPRALCFNCNTGYLYVFINNTCKYFF